LCRDQLELPLPKPSARLDDAGLLVKAPAPRPRELSWADLLRRTFSSEIFDCACGGRRRVVAFATDPSQAVEILASLGLPTEPPRPARARSPPVNDDLFAQAFADDSADPGFSDAYA
jgi:hypothetical protein